MNPLLEVKPLHTMTPEEFTNRTGKSPTTPDDKRAKRSVGRPHDVVYVIMHRENRKQTFRLLSTTFFAAESREVAYTDAGLLAGRLIPPTNEWTIVELHRQFRTAHGWEVAL